MCGIFGKASFTNEKLRYEDAQLMMEKIKHRGLDSSNIYVSPKKNVFLGHTRLSIIGDHGSQPVSNETGDIWMMCNGEIYNYLSLKEELIRLRHRFLTDTDVEVIIHLYEEYGINSLSYLRGSFAFAVYDIKKNLIFIARDRLGEKPLKYYYDDRVFMFSSEIKPILSQREYQKEIDYLAVHSFLTHGYIPPPMTGFKKINKLEAGHYSVVNLTEKKVYKNQYWDVNYSKKIVKSQSEWIQEIKDKLFETVKLYLNTDKQIGLFLSSGIDSSLILSLMKYFRVNIQTFSIGFSKKNIDESKKTLLLAKHYGTLHHQIAIHDKDALLLPEIAHIIEEPSADNNILALYLLSKHAQGEIKVVFTGDGGDELFIGYDRYLSYANNSYNNKAALGDYYIENEISLFNHKMKLLLYSQDTYKELHSIKSENYTRFLMNKHKGNDELDKILYTDLKSYISDMTLSKLDLITTRFQIESRAPLLDYQIVELLSKVPNDLKLKNNEKKYILKTILKDFIPLTMVAKQKKGLQIPWNVWFSEKKMSSFIYDIMFHSQNYYFSYMFDKKSLEKIIKLCVKHDRSHRRVLALLMLKLWMMEYFPL